VIHWLVVRSEHREMVGHALPRAWRGGEARVVDLQFPAHVLTFVWPEGAAARRPPHWPAVLSDWHDIYEDKLFPDDVLPVLAEEASGLGAEAVAVHGELGFAAASVGWYRKGALAEYEHVGSAQVAWTPDAGLGRPFDRSGRQVAAQASRRLAQLLGAGDFDDTLARLESTSKATGEAVLVSAMLRLIGGEPPPMDELAGMVAAARAGAVRLGA
jgi:hypothetical protein